jgi:parallel beta-helix repeat protein
MFPTAPNSARLTSFIAILIAVFALQPNQVAADTLTVTITDDAGPGTLRQAIIDANANAGADDLVFDIPTTDTRYNGSFWTIFLASALPTLSDSGTRILGSSQTANQGDTNPGVIGTGGTVGVDKMALPQYSLPEIQLDAGGFNGVTIGSSASDIVIEGFAIVHANNGIEVEAMTSVGVGGASRTVRSMLVGVFADGNDPAALRNVGHGIVVDAPAPGLPTAELDVELSYVGFNGSVGIVGDRGATKLNVSYCEVFANGQLSDAHDGIDVNGIAGQVRYNLSRDNTNVNGIVASGSGHGIEAGSQDPGTGEHVIENNTVLNNLGAGIAIRAGSSGNQITKNIASGNAAGIYVNAEQAGQTDGNVIAKNSTFANRGLAIDLHAGESGVAFDGVTLNSPNSGLGGSNRLVAYPVIEAAKLKVGMLIFSGFAAPGSIIDVFLAEADPTGFGEGGSHLFSVIEGSSDDADDTEGAYGPVVNQFVVSTEALTTNRFAFSVDVSALKVDSVLITATATVVSDETAAGKLASSNTSEFSPVILAVDPGSPVATEADEIPNQFRLLGAYPNPFNPSTTISFELDRPAQTTLAVFNALGVEVARLVESNMPAGSHVASWDARALPSGTYFYRLTVDGTRLSGAVTLSK